jgi:hypothetical protein
MSSSYWHPFDNKGVHAVSRGLSTPILRSISRHTRLTVLSSGDFTIDIDGISPSSLREQIFFLPISLLRASCHLSPVPWGPTCVIHPSSSFYGDENPIGCTVCHLYSSDIFSLQKYSTLLASRTRRSQRAEPSARQCHRSGVFPHFSLSD